MFMVDINGMRCLYTGDYSRVTDRHLSAADMPPVTPHIGGGDIYSVVAHCNSHACLYAMLCARGKVAACHLSAAVDAELHLDDVSMQHHTPTSSASL
jgi:hypothetical protein